MNKSRTGTEAVTIYHNPRCSKSRQTLALLNDQGIAPEVVEYLKTPPSTAEIADILNTLGLEPRQLMRAKEPEYAELGLDREELTREQLIQAMHDCPKLIERPIVVTSKGAAIGRPPENVLAVLDA